MYIFLLGGNLYVEATNSVMKEQLLFGSSYSFPQWGDRLGIF